jgi:hypothetical protein
MMGIPLEGKAYVFLENNQSVITSGTIPQSSLNKHHNASVYYHLHEVIASDMICFFHIDGSENLLDMYELSSLATALCLLAIHQPFLFLHRGPTQSPNICATPS